MNVREVTQRDLLCAVDGVSVEGAAEGPAAAAAHSLGLTLDLWALGRDAWSASTTQLYVEVPRTGAGREERAAEATAIIDSQTAKRAVRSVWPAPSASGFRDSDPEQSASTYPVSGRTLAKMEIRASWSS